MKKFLDVKQVVLISILMLAAVLRFWNLGNVPPSTSMDEASIGYNAYSVLKIGADEYGEFPLISQRGYDDWRRSTYLFLVVPFVALFDLHSISIRLPAAILSILTVWATYYIVLFLFSKRSEFSYSVSLLATFLLAISPWHIYISRLGHESNTCLAFFILGLLFFLQGEKSKSKSKIILSGIFFSLSVISYYSGQVFIPIFVIGLFFIFRKVLLAIIFSDKKTFISFFILLMFLIPMFKSTFSENSLIRFQGTGILKPEVHYWERFQKQIDLRRKADINNDIVGRIVYSKYSFLLKVFIEGYTAHFNPRWLLTNSSAEPHKVPNLGLLYVWEILSITLGIIVLLSSNLLDRKAKMLIFLWFFIAPLPAAIATQAPHAMRSYNFLPTWQIFSAFGLVYIFYALRKFSIFILPAFAVLILISLSTFYKNYFIIFPKEQSRSFHYPLSKVIPYVITQQDDYQKVVFSNKDNLYQSYMLFLYYSKYDPLVYQKQGGTKSGGFSETHVFGKYEFRPIIQTEKDNHVLYIGNYHELKNVKVLKTFKDLSGKETIEVFRER